MSRVVTSPNNISHHIFVISTSRLTPAPAGPAPHFSIILQCTVGHKGVIGDPISALRASLLTSRGFKLAFNSRPQLDLDFWLNFTPF